MKKSKLLNNILLSITIVWLLCALFLPVITIGQINYSTFHKCIIALTSEQLLSIIVYLICIFIHLLMIIFIIIRHFRSLDFFIALLAPIASTLISFFYLVFAEKEPSLSFGFYIVCIVSLIIPIIRIVIQKYNIGVIMNKKKILQYGVPALILIITLTLNITLISSDVFKGTYSYFQNDETNYLIFHENTFDIKTEQSTYNQGFYYLTISKNEEKNVTKTYVILSNTSSFERLSVFALKTSNDKIYICSTAILLQVFYGVLELTALAFLIKFAIHDILLASRKGSNNVDFAAFKFKLIKELLSRGMDENDLKYITDSAINKALRTGHSPESFADKFIPKWATISNNEIKEENKKDDE